MATVTLTGIGTIHSGAAPVASGGKTLVITSHGRLTGGTFRPAYATSLQFASPKYGALLAALQDAIDGKVEAAEPPLLGSQVQEHAMSWYQDDPDHAAIATKLAGKDVDVLTIRQDIHSTRARGAPRLSQTLKQLNAQGLTYPGVLCLFCRVVKNVQTGESLMSKDVTGGKHAVAGARAEQMKNAISIAQALKAKGVVT
jgi:hypothetical protein